MIRLECSLLCVDMALGVAFSSSICFALYRLLTTFRNLIILDNLLQEKEDGGSTVGLDVDTATTNNSETERILPETNENV